MVDTSLERGLPLNDKRLAQSFFWLSAENDRHIGCWDDDVDDMIFYLCVISSEDCEEQSM